MLPSTHYAGSRRWCGNLFQKLQVPGTVTMITCKGTCGPTTKSNGILVINKTINDIPD
jgi:hypothetical protein